MTAPVDLGGDVYSTKVIARRTLAGPVFELSLTRPPAFRFTAGQSVRLGLDGVERSYTLVSADGDPVLAVCIRAVGRGTLSARLTEAPVGTRLTLAGPNGYFTFQCSPRPAVFVATGTGIAPFVAMTRAGASGFTLLHGVRTSAELYYKEVVQPAAVRYVGCLSGEPSGGSAPAPRSAHSPTASPAVATRFAGRVTACAAQWPAGMEADFYLCGRSEMIRDMIELIDRRHPRSLVFTEAFF
jgi:benzoate/toluate 1,2-dioxygenase reductase component